MYLFAIWCFVSKLPTSLEILLLQCLYMLPITTGSFAVGLQSWVNAIRIVAFLAVLIVMGACGLHPLDCASTSCGLMVIMPSAFQQKFLQEPHQINENKACGWLVDWCTDRIRGWRCCWSTNGRIHTWLTQIIDWWCCEICWESGWMTGRLGFSVSWMFVWRSKCIGGLNDWFDLIQATNHQTSVALLLVETVAAGRMPAICKAKIILRLASKIF